MRGMRWLLGLGLVLSPGVAQAAAGHGGEFEFSVHGFYIIDFVVFVGLLVWFAKGPAKRFMATRHERIKAELETAQRLRGEAEKKLAEAEGLLTSLKTEIARISESFKADGERDRERILAEATANAEKLAAAAERQIAQETASVREQLERELVRAVLAATEEKIKAQLTADTQKQLAASYIESLEKLPSIDSAA